MDDDALVARHRLDVDAYARMSETGILGEGDRTELIDGELIDMAPVGQDHAATAISLNQALVLAFAGRALVSPQNPVRLDRFNEPQPDFAIIRPRADDYRAGERPGPADMLLLIEVAGSSLRFDRSVKLPLYARARIAEVWIVNLGRRVLTAHRRPAGDGYDEMTTHQPDDTISPAFAPDIGIPLARVFG